MVCTIWQECSANLDVLLNLLYDKLVESSIAISNFKTNSCALVAKYTGGMS